MIIVAFYQLWLISSAIASSMTGTAMAVPHFHFHGGDVKPSDPGDLV